MYFYWMSVMGSIEIEKQTLCVCVNCVLMSSLAANTRSHQEASLIVFIICFLFKLESLKFTFVLL